MAIDKNTVPNIDDSDPADYPNGQIRDNDGSDNGTPVNRTVFSDMFETFAKLMRKSLIPYNGGFDNESSGYQYVQALQNLAGKNDLIYLITKTTVVISGVNTNVLVLPVDIRTLELGELFICVVQDDYEAQTQIMGTVPGVYKAVASADSFKASNYVLIHNTSSGIKIIAFATAGNLNQMTAALNFLKAASQADENAGLINTSATTPLSNLTAFIRRVIGADSATYLASTVTNGLLSAADKIKIDTFEDPVRNRGWFSGLDPGGTPIGTNLPHSGGIVSAIVTAAATNDSVVRVTFANPMIGENYFVRSHLESQSNLGADDDLRCPVFSPVTSTVFDWAISDAVGGVQNIKVHLEVVQIS